MSEDSEIRVGDTVSVLAEVIGSAYGKALRIEGAGESQDVVGVSSTRWTLVHRPKVKLELEQRDIDLLKGLLSGVTDERGSDSIRLDWLYDYLDTLGR